MLGQVQTANVPTIHPLHVGCVSKFRKAPTVILGQPLLHPAVMFFPSAGSDHMTATFFQLVFLDEAVASWNEMFLQPALVPSEGHQSPHLFLMQHLLCSHERRHLFPSDAQQ